MVDDGFWFGIFLFKERKGKEGWLGWKAWRKEKEGKDGGVERWKVEGKEKGKGKGWSKGFGRKVKGWRVGWSKSWDERLKDSKLGHLPLEQKFDQVKLGRRSQRSKVVDDLLKVDDQRVEMKGWRLKVGSLEVGTKVWSGALGRRSQRSKVVEGLMKVDDQRVGMKGWRTQSWVIWGWNKSLIRWSWDVDLKGQRSKVWWKLMIKELRWDQLDSKLGHLPLVQKFDQVKLGHRSQDDDLMKVDDQRVEMRSVGLKVGSLAFGMKVWSGEVGTSTSKVKGCWWWSDESWWPKSWDEISWTQSWVICLWYKSLIRCLGTSISKVKGLLKVWWKLMIKELGWDQLDSKLGHLPLVWRFDQVKLGRRPRAGALGSKWGHLRMGRRPHRELGGGTRKWEKETLEKSVES
jgi:hypothetical protein